MHGTSDIKDSETHVIPSKTPVHHRRYRRAFEIKKVSCRI
jgi:hypothetical protein